MDTQTNRRPHSQVTTTVDRVEAYRRVTLVTDDGVWSSRTLYDSTSVETSRVARVNYGLRSHKHLVEMWGASVVFVSVFAILTGIGLAAFAIFAPVLQETLTHWRVS